MGTSGAFGGSATKAWAKVKTILDGGLVAPDSGGPDPPAPSPDEQQADPTVNPPAATGAPPQLGELLAAIADALKVDDPAIRPRFAPVRRTGDSGLFFGTMAGTRSRGSTQTAPTGGRRQIAAGARRGGRAVGAGYALAAGDAQRLADYGLDLAQLQSKSRPEQILAILDALDSKSAGPDDLVLRQAIYRQLSRVLGDDDVPTPAEAVRDLVVDYTNGLALIEIEAWSTRQGHDTDAVINLEHHMRAYIEVAASRLDLSAASVVSPAQFEHAAQEILRALLAVIPKEARR